MDMSAFLAAPLQINKICRACLTEKGDMKPLFGACLDEMLESFAHIQIQEGDGLPSKMCVQCILQCSRAYTFKQLCEKSETILRTFFSPEFQIQLKEYTEVKPDAEQTSILSSELPDVLEDDEMPTELVEYDEATTEYFNMENVTLTVEEATEIQDPDEISKSEPEEERNNINNDFKCKKCEQTFSLKVDLKVHMMSHPKELEYKCEICQKSFAEARILKRHSKIHLAKKPHQCDQCDMSFAESSNLSKHKKKHTGELRNIIGKPHLCSVCGRAFKWSSSLSKHMKYHTGHKLHTCQFCTKQYVEARSLKIHMRSHTGERPYSCPVCCKSFTQVCNLEKHLRVHTGEKPYACPVCGKGFTQSGYVSIHMRTHTGERPYICQTCGKAFAGSNTLTIHQRIHTGEKPYLCNICGKRFSRLKAHQRLHALVKLVPCKICGHAFGRPEELVEHMHSHAEDTVKVSKVETVQISDLLTGETSHCTSGNIE